MSKVIDLKPDYADVYTHRGMVYYRKGEMEHAIADYTKVIELKPTFAEVCCNRGEAWLHLREWEKAKSDLTIARDMGADIIASFHNDYESVPDFEGKHEVKLPEDIAEMLTPQERATSKEAEWEATHESASDFEIVLDEVVRKYDRAWKTLAKP